jgi:hypothetical protein
MANLSIPGAGGGSSLTKATGAEINTGTDDAKYITAKAITDSNVAFLSDIPAGATPGTFTPALVSSGGGAPTYNQRAGSYMTIGNRLFFSLRIFLTDKGTLGAGSMTITGLPTAAVNTTGLNHTFPLLLTNTAILAPNNFYTFLAANSSTLGLFKISGMSIAAAQVADVGADAAIVITGSYAIS